MYLTDLTDAQKNNIKGTVLMENWRRQYDFFLILDVIVYVDASGCLWGLLPEKYPKWQLVSAFPWIIRIYTGRGYRGDFVEKARHNFGIDVYITHSNYSGKFVPAKKRWVAEKALAWLECFRRLCRNYEDTTYSAIKYLWPQPL